MNASRARLGTHCARLLVLLLGLAAPARAQQGADSDVDMLRQQLNAPPNVMLLFDSSKSMWTVVFAPTGTPADDFNRNYAYPRECNLSAATTSGGVPRYTSADDYVQVSGSGYTTVTCSFGTAACADWVAKVPRASGLPSGTASCKKVGSSWEYYLPDVDTTANETWWNENHLNYLFRNLRTRNSLPVNFVAETRVQAGKKALDALVKEFTQAASGSNCATYDERVRFGLARFRVSSPVGGYVSVPIASCNRSAVLNGIASFYSDDGGTPLASALINVARYFTGAHWRLGRDPKDGSPAGYATYDRRTSDGAVSASQAPPSPINPDLLCQKNFIVYITDGEPSSDNGVDSTMSSALFGASTPSLDKVTRYLAQNDLIPTAGFPGDQKIPTYTVGFGIDVPLLSDAALAGDASYYTAEDATELAAKLKESIEDILLRSASFAASSVPASRTGSDDLYVQATFRPGPRGQLSEGHLQAYQITTDFTLLGAGGVVATEPDPSAPSSSTDPEDAKVDSLRFKDGVLPVWDAQTALLAASHPARRLFVNLPDPNFVETNPGLDATAFGLSAADQGKYPNSLSPLLSPSELAKRLVRYGRGLDAFDEDKDGNVTEKRPVVLGEIFHSDPLLVGGPSFFLERESGFGPLDDPNSFFGQNRNRDRVVYAGANDGFLHAFDAGQRNPSTGIFSLGTGQERFGFMPKAVIANARGFARTDLPRPIFVDGPAAVVDAWIPHPLPSVSPTYNKLAQDWSTVLVAGLRNGGKSYFALDVTKPSQVTSGAHFYPTLLWEFTHAQLGYTWAKPVLTRVKVAKSGAGDFCIDSIADGDCVETWVAVLAGGYVTAGDPAYNSSISTSLTQSSGIFIVELAPGSATGKLLAYQPTGKGCSLPASPAVVDENGDGYADLIYAGDTCGNLLKWDLSRVGVRSGTAPNLVTNWPFGVFFTAPQATFATAPTRHYRSFFSTPSVSRVKGIVTVAIGTGERTDLDYATRNASSGGDLNHLYVLRDRIPVQRDASAPASIPSTPYTLSEFGSSRLNGKERIALTDQSALGFYLELQANEKVTTDSLAYAGRLFVGTFSWDSSTSASCTPRGTSSLIRLSLLDGSGDGTASGDTNNDGKIDEPDKNRRFHLGPGMVIDSPRPSVGPDGKAYMSMRMTGGGDQDEKDRDRFKKVAAPKLEQAVEWIFWRTQ